VRLGQIDDHQNADPQDEDAVLQDVITAGKEPTKVRALKAAVSTLKSSL
jgi:hypothetical protein